MESTLSSSTGETVIAQEELSGALSRLIVIYEKRVTRLQDEINRLKIENEDLRAKAGIKTTAPSVQPVSSPTITASPSTAPLETSSTVAPPKTEQEKRYDAIVSNIVSSLPEILTKNSLTATGTIGLFEFIEPKNFFISLDDGKNPAGVTAFKTKILYEFDSNLNLKLIGVFDLDYASQRYVTVKGKNPFGGVARIRIKNPGYTGKLLDEIAPAPSATQTSTISSAVTTVTKPPVSPVSTGSG